MARLSGESLPTVYIQPDKPKSRIVLQAFAKGCGAKIGSTLDAELRDGPAVFYGVRPGWQHLWNQAKAEGRDWYYVDNSVFDCAREQQFRIARNRIQHTGRGESDGKRLAALGVKVKPMREDGEHVVLAAQSQEFMQVVAGDPGWLDRMTTGLRAIHGDRVIVRTKHTARPLATDLKNAGLLVTWSSAAAVTALLEGIRVLCAPECCATYAGADRAKWAAVLADNQFDLSEIASGKAWKAINGA